jgi:hypothetical protein
VDSSGNVLSGTENYTGPATPDPNQVPLMFFGGQAAPSYFGGQALNVAQTPLTIDDINALSASKTPQKSQTFADWFNQHQQLVLILGGLGILVVALESGGGRRR